MEPKVEHKESLRKVKIVKKSPRLFGLAFIRPSSFHSSLFLWRSSAISAAKLAKRAILVLRLFRLLRKRNIAFVEQSGNRELNLWPNLDLYNLMVAFVGN